MLFIQMFSDSMVGQDLIFTHEVFVRVCKNLYVFFICYWCCVFELGFWKVGGFAVFHGSDYEYTLTTVDGIAIRIIPVRFSRKWFGIYEGEVLRGYDCVCVFSWYVEKLQMRVRKEFCPKLHQNNQRLLDFRDVTCQLISIF